MDHHLRDLLVTKRKRGRGEERKSGRAAHLVNDIRYTRKCATLDQLQLQLHNNIVRSSSPGNLICENNLLALPRFFNLHEPTSALLAQQWQALSRSNLRVLPTTTSSAGKLDSPQYRTEQSLINIGSGGTSGSVVAARLAEDTNSSVLVIEAGQHNSLLENTVMVGGW